MQNSSLPLEGKGDRIAVDEVFLSICAKRDAEGVVPYEICYSVTRYDCKAISIYFAKRNEKKRDAVVHRAFLLIILVIVVRLFSLVLAGDNNLSVIVITNGVSGNALD